MRLRTNGISPRDPRFAVAVVLATVIGVPLLATGMTARTGADQVRHLVVWPDDCASISVAAPPSPWRRAVQDKMIACEMLGPRVRYARFRNLRALKADLLASPPDSAVCIYNSQVVVNGLEAHQFPKLCGQLHGQRVDGVVGLPDIPGGVTGDSNERAAERQSRRDARAEYAALLAFFRRTSG